VIAAATVFIVTAAFMPFGSFMTPTEVALTLLLVVLFSSTLFGSTAGLVASVAAIACFNFFFLPPIFTFTISDPQNLVAFATFVITALISGQLSGYARRRAEESEARQREIERLYEELQAAFEQASEAEALRKSEKLKSALLDAVTHDLRTPLTSIKASVTTLIEDSKEDLLDAESQQEFLEIIDEETDRLNEFIEGMVGIAKIEANAMSLHKRVASVEEIVGNAVERAKRVTGRHTVAVSLQPDLPNVYADAASIAEVVFTLIDNAAKYSNAGTSISISAVGVEDHVDLIVQDQGKGIDPSMRTRVFDKFFRSDEQDIHKTGSGLGLGLAIAKGIVESQGGSIGIEDGDAGFVTRFVVSLPVSEERTTERTTPSAEAAATPPS
jgi:two-component system sensor histidine kinase KdpD